MPVSVLARAEGVQSSTITVTTKRLQDMGYVRRERSAGDERVVVVSLTEAAERQLGAWKDAQLRAISGLVERLAQGRHRTGAVGVGVVQRDRREADDARLTPVGNHAGGRQFVKESTGDIAFALHPDRKLATPFRGGFRGQDLDGVAKLIQLGLDICGDIGDVLGVGKRANGVLDAVGRIGAGGKGEHGHEANQ